MSQVTAGLPQTPAAWLVWGNQILQTQAFSVLLGAKLTGLDRGHCELSLVLSAQHLQQHGFAHGGVVSYMADNALTYACGTALGSKLASTAGDMFGLELEAAPSCGKEIACG